MILKLLWFRRSFQASGALDLQNVIFDETGHFLIYCTMLGVKVVNLVTNKLARVLGRHENVRFLQATLFQARFYPRPAYAMCPMLHVIS